MLSRYRRAVAVSIASLILVGGAGGAVLLTRGSAVKDGQHPQPVAALTGPVATGVPVDTASAITPIPAVSTPAPGAPTASQTPASQNPAEGSTAKPVSSPTTATRPSNPGPTAPPPAGTPTPQATSSPAPTPTPTPIPTAAPTPTPIPTAPPIPPLSTVTGTWSVDVDGHTDSGNCTLGGTQWTYSFTAVSLSFSASWTGCHFLMYGMSANDCTSDGGWIMTPIGASLDLTTTSPPFTSSYTCAQAAPWMVSLQWF